MFITALCPTYRHPELLANSLALWLLQDYPLEKRQLIILDDGMTFDMQGGEGWSLISTDKRVPSLPKKYNMLAKFAPASSAFLVWEDDDIYLPNYVSSYAKVLAKHELCKPAYVLSDYNGKLEVESGIGRFHSSLSFRRELFDRIGGWPNTKRADFDQQFISLLEKNCESRGEPFPSGDIGYIYSWHTGASHGQNFMRSPDDETWYERAETDSPKVPHVGKLIPKLDERTKKYL